MDLFLQTIRSLQSEEIPPDMGWLTDAQPLALKLFQHLGSLFHLARETIVPLGRINISYIDHASITVLARSAFETYLAFYYIFVAPPTVQEKLFRYKLWQLGGLLDRQRFSAFSDMAKGKAHLEKEMVDCLQEEIQAGPFYKQLDCEDQKKARQGKWRFNKSWTDLAKIAGFDRVYFEVVYCYLCSYAHTSYLSIVQIGQADSKETQGSLAETWLGLGLGLMSHFIFALVSIYPKAHIVLSNFPDALRTASIWNDIGRGI